MSVKLQPNLTQTAWELRLCQDYWSFDNNGGFIRFVNQLCLTYGISAQVLFETVAQCYACLDDVCCNYCGVFCPVEVPADIPYWRSKDNWCCAVCESALWRTPNHR